MKAEADRAGAPQATPPTARAAQMGGSVLGDPPGDGDKGHVRALLDRVRAIRDDPQQQHHSFYPPHSASTSTHPRHDSSYDDALMASGEYKRPRWQPSSSAREHECEREEPPSYYPEHGRRRHGYDHDPDPFQPPYHRPSHGCRHGDDGDDDELCDARDHVYHPNRYESKSRAERAHARGGSGYEDEDDDDDDHRNSDFARGGGSARSSSSTGYQDHRRHPHVPLMSESDYRPRYRHGHRANDPAAYELPPAAAAFEHHFLPPPVSPPVPRHKSAWKEEAGGQEAQYAYRTPVFPAAMAGGAYPPPRSYPPPLIENLQQRRNSNPAIAPAPVSPASHHRQHRSTYGDGRRHRHHQEREHRDERAVTVRHEPRSPPHSKARRAAHEVSSYQSTSNSSAVSFVSNDEDEEEDDGAFGHRDVAVSVDEDDDDADDDDADDVDDDDNALSDFQRRAVHLARLTPEMYEDHELHSDFRHALHMVIPTSAIGCLIGNRGAIIRRINAQTQCTLSIRDPDAFSIKDDRVLRIYGKAKGICLAQHLVIEKIRMHRVKKQDPSYVPLFQGTKLFTLPPLPENSVTKSMIDFVAALPNSQRQKKQSSSSSDGESTNGSLKWLVSSENVGRVMGSGGAILAAIARDTTTKIHITPSHEMPRGGKVRRVNIYGTPENIEAARQQIERKAGGRAETPGYNGKCGQYFAIPYATAGALIGVKGSVSRSISEQTGARLQILTNEDLPLGSVNRTVHIQGNRQQIEAAHAIACSMVREELAAKAENSEAAALEPLVTIKIILSARIARFFLEQHGRLIREISEKSGTHAHFAPPLDDETRICIIRGEMPAVFRAERLILQFVAGDTIATKQGGANSLGFVPREKRKRRTNDSDEEEEEEEDNGDGFDDEERTAALRGMRGVHPDAARRGGRPTKRVSVASSANDNPGNRRVKVVARLNGKRNGRAQSGSGSMRPNPNQRSNPERHHDYRGSGEKEPDIIDRLQAPLQSSRSGGNPNKRQRR